MKLNKQNMGICAYCGLVSRITKDHIPPKSLFPNPKPINLITVPSCYNCNQKFSKDDEYFRLVLSCREDLFDNSTIRRLFPTVMRSLSNPKKTGFSKKFINTLKYSNIYTNAGIFLGKKHTYDIELERVKNVVSRIVRGLYYHHKKIVLQERIQISVYMEENLINWDVEKEQAFWKEIIRHLSHQELHQIGQIFEYKFLITNDDEETSFWLIRLYEKIIFLVFTINLDHNAEKQ